MFIKVLYIFFQAGNYVIDDVVGNLIQLISESTTLHTYTVQQLWKQLMPDLATKQPLVQVASWCIGEFGDLLNSNEGQDASPVNVSFLFFGVVFLIIHKILILYQANSRIEM